MTTGYLQETKWSVGDMVFVLLGGLVAAQIAAIFVYGIGGSSPGAFYEIGVIVAVQSFGSLGTAAFLSLRKGTGNWATDFGFVMNLRDSWALFLGFGLQIVFALVTAPLIDRFAPNADSPQQAITAIAEGATGAGSQFLIIVAVGLLAPIVEEVAWRGMLLSRLLRSMTRPRAVAVQALCFAGLHVLLDPGSYLVAPGLFLVGAVLGVLALRYGNLGIPIFTHAGVNLTSILLLFYADALVEYAEQVESLLHVVRLR